WTTAGRRRAWVERVSVPAGLRATTRTSRPARGGSRGGAAPAGRGAAVPTAGRGEGGKGGGGPRGSEGGGRRPAWRGGGGGRAEGDGASDVGRVVAHAVDEVGVTTVLEPLTEYVHALDRGHAALLGDLAMAVEHGHA